MSANIVEPDGKNITVVVRPNNRAVFTGQIIKLLLAGQHRPITLDIWALPEFICNNISFSIPNISHLSYSMRSDFDQGSFCIFPSFQSADHPFQFGSRFSPFKARIEVFTDQSTRHVYPYSICNSMFCEISLSIPFFFRVFRLAPSSGVLFIDSDIVTESYSTNNTNPFFSYNVDGIVHKNWTGSINVQSKPNNTYISNELIAIVFLVVFIFVVFHLISQCRNYGKESYTDNLKIMATYTNVNSSYPLKLVFPE